MRLLPRLAQGRFLYRVPCTFAAVKQLHTVSEVQAWRAALPGGCIVALVPTMGFLHEGHLSLLREARRRAKDGKVVLSIFVNPTQFGPGEDLARYPRDVRGDLQKAAACGVDMVFCPQTVDELYPGNTAVWVDIDGLGEHLCGATRPGHFRGVCTIVSKLWAVVRPHVSLFGEKDFQQLAILKAVHRALFFPGEVVGMPIVRESDGLAMSSRNTNLTPAARRAALAIPKFLATVRGRFESGVRSVAELIGDAQQQLAPGEIAYVEVVEPTTLQPIAEVQTRALCALAVHFGGVRLIDNTVLE